MRRHLSLIADVFAGIILLLLIIFPRGSLIVLLPLFGLAVAFMIVSRYLRRA
jgi:hypothetical protein